MKKLMLISLMLQLLPTAHAEIVVIVSSKSPVENLAKDQVSDIFLGKTPTFPDGTLAVPIELAPGVGVRDEFHDQVTEKSESQIRSYWSKMLFSGKGSPPKEVSNNAEMLKLIVNNPNMIGYVDKASVDASVKKVFSP